MSLKVLTFNCWGLKYVSKNREDRIKAIAARFAQLDHDLIACQELWVSSDYELIKNTCSNLRPYSRSFYSGALGSGLTFFSKYPILRTTCHPYLLNGEPLDVAGGDWFVGKAVVSIIIQHPILGPTQLFNTHLYAKGGEDGPEHLRAHRLVNAWQFSQLTRQAAELGYHVIALGDFNSTPETLPYKLILEHAGLSDAWLSTNSPESTGTDPHRRPDITSPQDAILKLGITADSPLNSYSAGKPLDPYARRNGGKRLDYILFRSPRLECAQSSVIMTELVPGHSFSYSDHFGLEATFTISNNDTSSSSSPTPHAPSQQLTDPGISSDTISKTMLALASCLRFSRYRSRKELLIFAISLVCLIVAILVSPWWLPNQPGLLNPIFTLFIIFFSWLATTMLYSGLIFGKWERNALMTILEELEIIQEARELIHHNSTSQSA